MRARAGLKRHPLQAAMVWVLSSLWLSSHALLFFSALALEEGMRARAGLKRHPLQAAMVWVLSSLWLSSHALLFFSALALEEGMSLKGHLLQGHLWEKEINCKVLQKQPSNPAKNINI